MGKGDKRRPENNKRYRENYDKVFAVKAGGKRYCPNCGKDFIKKTQHCSLCHCIISKE